MYRWQGYFSILNQADNTFLLYFHQVVTHIYKETYYIIWVIWVISVYNNNNVFFIKRFCLSCSVREAATKVTPLITRQLRGQGGVGGLHAGP